MSKNYKCNLEDIAFRFAEKTGLPYEEVWEFAKEVAQHTSNIMRVAIEAETRTIRKNISEDEKWQVELWNHEDIVWNTTPSFRATVDFIKELLNRK